MAEEPPSESELDEDEGSSGVLSAGVLGTAEALEAAARDSTVGMKANLGSVGLVPAAGGLEDSRLNLDMAGVGSGA